MHAPYFKGMDEHVRDRNRKLGKRVVFVVAVGQGVIALREKALAGQAPGLKAQGERFSDAIGQARPLLQALAAYCHLAVICRQSPVGVPVPAVLEKENGLNGDAPTKGRLNRLLQELAWEAAVQHPLSGVRA